MQALWEILSAGNGCCAEPQKELFTSVAYTFKHNRKVKKKPKKTFALAEPADCAWESASVTRTATTIPSAFASKKTNTATAATHLPPLEGLVREGAVLPAHQRVDGLVEALREPRVGVVRLGHAAPAGARTLGEEVVRLAEGVLDEVERGVPEGVAEEQRREGEDAKEQGESLHLPPLRQGHVGSGPKDQKIKKNQKWWEWPKRTGVP